MAEPEARNQKKEQIQPTLVLSRCVCTCTCVARVCACACVSMCMGMCMSVCVCARVSVYAYAYACLRACACLRVHICAHYAYHRTADIDAKAMLFFSASSFGDSGMWCPHSCSACKRCIFLIFKFKKNSNYFLYLFYCFSSVCMSVCINNVPEISRIESRTYRSIAQSDNAVVNRLRVGSFRCSNIAHSCYDVNTIFQYIRQLAL